MPRNGPAPRRDLLPDPVHRSVLVTQLTNKVLSRGKRTLAESIVYDALAVVAEKTASDPIPTLKRALDNVRPELEVKSRRVGGATYQVPVEVRPKRATTLSIRWLVRLAEDNRHVRISHLNCAEKIGNEARRDEAELEYLAVAVLHDDRRPIEGGKLGEREGERAVDEALREVLDRLPLDRGDDCSIELDAVVPDRQRPAIGG